MEKEIPRDEEPAPGLAHGSRAARLAAPAWRHCLSCGGLAAPPAGSEPLSWLDQQKKASAGTRVAPPGGLPGYPILGPFHGTGAPLQEGFGSSHPQRRHIHASPPPKDPIPILQMRKRYLKVDPDASTGTKSLGDSEAQPHQFSSLPAFLCPKGPSCGHRLSAWSAVHPRRPRCRVSRI